MNTNINKEHNYIEISTDFNQVNIDVHGADFFRL